MTDPMIFPTEQDLAGARVLVLGAGVLGAATAAIASRRGAEVTLVDRSLALDNASAVAAGMIAPGFEAVLDPGGVGHAALLREGGLLWPAFSASFALDARFHGARWIGPAEPLMSRLQDLGFVVEANLGGFRVEGEGQVDPLTALQRLRANAVHLVEDDAIAVGAGARATLRRLGEWRGDAVVLAVGGAEGVKTEAQSLRAALQQVSPVKGQILTFWGAPPEAVGTVLRAPDIYLAPQADRVLAGATMEPGVADTSVDPVVVERLRAAALRLAPALATREKVEARAGIRGASPDGLPLAGPLDPGLYAALAPRRNGWLLAPLVGQIVADAIAGRDQTRAAAALSPARFDTGQV